MSSNKGSTSKAKAAGAGSSLSIPESVRKIISNIKEISAGNDDYEIYATLKECNMDPNETAQKLLSQEVTRIRGFGVQSYDSDDLGTFLEVKSKRDRRKETSSNKESTDLRWKPGQGRGNKGGRGSYSARHTSNDTGGRNSSVTEKSAIISSPSASQEPVKNETSVATSFSSAITNGPSAIVTKGSKADISKLGGPAPHKHSDIVKGKPREHSVTGKPQGQLMPCSNNKSTVESKIISPGGHISPSDPVLVPSQDSRIPGAAGTIKREVRSQQTSAEQISHLPSEEKKVDATPEVGNSSMEGNLTESKSLGVGNNHQSVSALRPSSAHGVSSVARPSSNHSSRSHQVVGPAKVVPAKEWKAKSSNPPLARGSSPTDQPEVFPAMKVNTQSQPATGGSDSKEASVKLQKKLGELNISARQHVILPNHLHVPGAEKVSFRFGSFDAIGLATGSKIVPDDIISAPPLETCQSEEELADQTPSLQTALEIAKEGVYDDHPQSPEHVSENIMSTEHDVPGAGSQEYGETKQESDLTQGNHQYPVIHASPGYGCGLIPTMVGGQVPQYENTESQGRDVPRAPNFLMPQMIDPAAFYAQFPRSIGDGDGRVSPFHTAAGVATKYNGSMPVLPQTSQSSQEGGNSTSAPTAFATQPAPGVVPGSIPVTQQPIQFFRQPFGIPFPHYAPNYIPYNPYVPQYLAPPFNTGAYPQQFQAPPGPPKYSLSQYKTATSSGNTTSIGVASNYGPYGPAASTSGNSTTNDDLTAQQLKENNVYIMGQQQNEGPAMWLSGRDMPGVQGAQFYNMPPQGQVAFPQPGHGPFTGIYHTAATTGHPLLQQSQSMASANDIQGPPPNIYQQPQHTQVTWPNNNY